MRRHGGRNGQQHVAGRNLPGGVITDMKEERVDQRGAGAFGQLAYFRWGYAKGVTEMTGKMGSNINCLQLT